VPVLNPITDKEVEMLHYIFKKKPVLIALALMLGGLAYTAGKEAPVSRAYAAAPVSGPSAAVPLPSAYDLSTAIAKVAQAAIPAVVHIEVTQRSEVNNPMLPFENNPFFHFFFNGPQMPRKFKQEMKGIGSGIIMDPQGHILTNNHVAGGATDIQVTLADGRQFPAKVVGADPRGLDESVSQGIISAKHRTGISDPSSYQDFLQTDAPINPGNSGGPLLNLKGEVIGINAAIATNSGGFEGIGFAIPSNMATKIADTLIAHGKVERGWLGVSVSDVKPDAAKSMGLPSPKGALVAEVVKGSPAAEAGLKHGDVVLSYQGQPVADSSALRNSVADTPIGQQAKISVWRDKEKRELVVKIGSMEDAMKVKNTASIRAKGSPWPPSTPRVLSVRPAWSRKTLSFRSTARRSME
jgi:serine protease Do